MKVEIPQTPPREVQKLPVVTGSDPAPFRRVKLHPNTEAVLHYVIDQGMAPSEAAAALNMNRVTVQSHLAKAVNQGFARRVGHGRYVRTTPPPLPAGTPEAKAPKEVSVSRKATTPPSVPEMAEVVENLRQEVNSLAKKVAALEASISAMRDPQQFITMLAQLAQRGPAA